MKYFNKCCHKLAKTFREMFVSVQTIHRIFQKSFRNLPRNDNGNVYATFLVIFKIFVQGCRNIGSKCSEPSYEYFEKLCLKHSARFSVIKELAWNISINVFLKTCQKISWNDYVLCSSIQKIFQKSFRNLFCSNSANVYATFSVVLRKIFLQVCGNIRSISLWLRYGYFENIFRKVYAIFCVSFRVLNKKLVWNISINVAANLLKHFVKYLCPLRLKNSRENSSEISRQNLTWPKFSKFLRHFRRNYFK